MAKYTGCILNRQFMQVIFLRVDFAFVSFSVSRSNFLAAFFWKNTSFTETSWLTILSYLLIQEVPLFQCARENWMVLMGPGDNLGFRVLLKIHSGTLSRHVAERECKTQWTASDWLFWNATSQSPGYHHTGFSFRSGNLGVRVAMHEAHLSCRHSL